MTVPATDRVTTMVIEGQRAVTDVLGVVSRTWTEALRGAAVPGAPVVPMVPVVPAEVVDRFFDTGVQILEAQRAVVQGTLEMFRGPSAPAGR